MKTEKSFQELKQLCSSLPFLAYAYYTKPFKLHTDASNLGLSAVLYQIDEDGLEKVIAYASRTLSKSERNYPAYILEVLALKWATTDHMWGAGETFLYSWAYRECLRLTWGVPGG